MSPDASLVGVRVLDLTRNLAGPFCTMVLGELGANVVKLETTTGGDDTRAWAPLTESGDSAMFLSANRNKRSIAVDLDSPAGVEIVTRLAERADVVVESFRPGALDRRGLGWDDLRTISPALIYCSISAFGGVGPRRDELGYDPVIQAASGIMAITGSADGSPARLGVAAVDLGTGIWAVVGILLALAERERTGRGSLVETSLFETAGWWLSCQVAGLAATGAEPARHGSASPSIAPYEAYETAEGELFVAAANDKLFHTLCGVLELPELPDDARFVTNALRVENVEPLRSVLTERLRARTAVSWERLLKERNLPCSRVASVGEFVRDSQLSALRMLAPVPVPKAAGAGQDIQLVAIPMRFDGIRPKPRHPPPSLGEHTEDVLQGIGYTTAQIAALRRQRVVR